MKALRILTLLLGIVFFLQGLGWIVDPSSAAATLGMPYLDGLGRSTQAADFATFFLAAGVTILLGNRAGWTRLLYVPAGMMLCAATLRIVAWAVHGADFAALFITVEVVSGAILIRTAQHELASPDVPR